MINYNEISIKYDSAPFPPDDIRLDVLYSITKKNGKLFVIGNGIEIEMEKNLIKSLFNPKDVKWEEVSFEDEITSKKYIDK